MQIAIKSDSPARLTAEQGARESALPSGALASASVSIYHWRNAINAGSSALTECAVIDEFVAGRNFAEAESSLIWDKAINAMCPSCSNGVLLEPSTPKGFFRHGGVYCLASRIHAAREGK